VRCGGALIVSTFLRRKPQNEKFLPDYPVFCLACGKGEVEGKPTLSLHGLLAPRRARTSFENAKELSGA
jgi:hypothetical protein